MKMNKYQTILIDPPYSEKGAGKCKRGADKHYNLMTLKEMKEYFKLNLLDKIDDNAHLYLWVTNNFLQDGLELMDFLGFRYITNLVWIKDKIGLGQYFRGKYELCLFGVKGEFYSNSNKESTIIFEKRTRHSQKPYAIYRKIEKVSRELRLEVFARHRREGWDCLGDQVPKDTQLLLNR